MCLGRGVDTYCPVGKRRRRETNVCKRLPYPSSLYLIICTVSDFSSLSFLKNMSSFISSAFDCVFLKDLIFGPPCSDHQSFQSRVSVQLYPVQ